jgi:uncharacterized membrane protein (DUF441 family)
MSTASFRTFIAARRRGVILGALAECAPGTAAAADLLHRYLLSIAMRHTVGEVEADLAWLAENGLVQVGQAGSLVTAVITGRGREVVQRLVTVPGVDVSDSASA